MKRWIWLSLFCLFLLAACNNGIQSGTGGLPAASTPSPAEISSSAQVVKLSSSPAAITQNGSTEAVVTLSITPGFHINANPASFSYLIATELQPGKLDGITAGKPVYPAAITRKFKFADRPLAVYEGEVAIKVPLKALSSLAAGAHSLSIKVRVQACDEEKCYAPDFIPGAISVTAN